jgi:purine nucleosidase
VGEPLSEQTDIVRRIVLDTDLAMGAPGSDIDDGFALALAVADPDLRLDLVTTVRGNTDVDTATRLSHELLDRLGQPDIPVVRGAATGMFGARPTAAQGAAPDRAEHAAAALVEHVMSAPGQVTIVAIGPLTNVAIALLLEPRLATAVQEVVVMGGVFESSTNLAAMPGEFNIWCDPDAADLVLRSGCPLRFVGLDVTRRVRLTRRTAAAFAAGGGDFAAFAGECTTGWIDYHGQCNPGDPLEQDSCALHDPLAVAAVSHPELLTWRPAFVQVERMSPVTRGVMVSDFLTSDRPPAANCQVATAVDADGFLDLFSRRIEGL